MDQVKTAFKQFLSAANSPHGLDAYTKQAMAIALSVALRCEPCLKMHLKNARKKGLLPGRDRRGRLDGHQLRGLAGDGVLRAGQEPVVKCEGL